MRSQARSRRSATAHSVLTLQTDATMTRGRFFGSGVTNPRRFKIRHTVVSDGTGTRPLTLEMPTDRRRTVIQMFLAQLLPQLDDAILDLDRRPRR